MFKWLSSFRDSLWSSSQSRAALEIQLEFGDKRTGKRGPVLASGIITIEGKEIAYCLTPSVLELYSLDDEFKKAKLEHSHTPREGQSFTCGGQGFIAGNPVIYLGCQERNLIEVFAPQQKTVIHTYFTSPSEGDAATTAEGLMDGITCMTIVPAREDEGVDRTAVVAGSTSGMVYAFNSLDSPAPSGVLNLTLPNVGEGQEQPGRRSPPAVTAVCYLHDEFWVGLENGSIVVLDREFTKLDTLTSPSSIPSAESGDEASAGGRPRAQSFSGDGSHDAITCINYCEMLDVVFTLAAHHTVVLWRREDRSIEHVYPTSIMTCGTPLSAFTVVQLNVKMELPVIAGGNPADGAGGDQEGDQEESRNDGSDDNSEEAGDREQSAEGADAGTTTPKKKHHKKKGKKHSKPGEEAAQQAANVQEVEKPVALMVLGGTDGSIVLRQLVKRATDSRLQIILLRHYESIADFQRREDEENYDEYLCPLTSLVYVPSKKCILVGDAGCRVHGFGPLDEIVLDCSSMIRSMVEHQEDRDALPLGRPDLVASPGGEAPTDSGGECVSEIDLDDESPKRGDDLDDDKPMPQIDRFMQSEDVPSLLEFSIDVNESLAVCGKDGGVLAVRDKENVEMSNTLEGHHDCSTDKKDFGDRAGKAVVVLSPTPPVMTPPPKGPRPRPRTVEAAARPMTARSSGAANLAPPNTSRSLIGEDVFMNERGIPPRPKSVGGSGATRRAPTNMHHAHPSGNCDISLLSSYRIPSPSNSSAISGDSKVVTSTAPNLASRPSTMRPTINDLAQKGHEVCTCGASKIWERIRARHVAELQEAKKVKQSAAKIREEARALERDKTMMEEQMQHLKSSKEDLQKQKQRVQAMWENTKKMQSRELEFKEQVMELEAQRTSLMREKERLVIEAQELRSHEEVLRGEMKRSHDEAAEWKEQVELLTKQTCDCDAKLTALETRQKILNAQEAKWKSELKANKEEVKKAEMAVEQATKQLNDQAVDLAKREAALAATKKELHVEKEKLRSEREASDWEFSKLQAAKENADTRQEAIERREAAIEEELKRIEEQRNEILTLEAELTKMKEEEKLERAALREEKEASIAERSKSQAMLEELEAKRNELEAAELAIKEEIQKLDERRTALEQREAELQKANEELTVERQCLAKDREMAVCEYDKNQTISKDLNSRMEELQRTEASVEEMKARLEDQAADLENREAALKYAMEELNVERGVLREEREFNERKYFEVQSSLDALSARKEELEEREAAADEKLESLNDHTQQLKVKEEELRQMSQELESEKEALKEEKGVNERERSNVQTILQCIKAKKEEISKTEKAIEEDRQNLDAERMAFETQRQELQNEREETTLERKRITEEKAAAEEERSKNIATLKEIEIKEEEVRKAGASLEEARHSLDEHRKELERRETAVLQARERVAAEQEKLAEEKKTIDQEKSKVRAALESLNAREVSGGRHASQELESGKASIAEEKETVKLELSRLQAASEDLNARTEEIQKREAAVEERTSMLYTDASELKNKEAELERISQELSSERNILIEQRNANEREHARTQSALKELDARKEEIEKAENSIAEAQRRLDDHSSELAHQKATLMREIEELDLAKMNLDEERAAGDDLRMNNQTMLEEIELKRVGIREINHLPFNTLNRAHLDLTME
ncbi:hypothetical protein FOL47_004532 [Perkinsus chesapeaki]|uniref:Uncharacterized protein n=1 Tax=Perkinsus chesapeaki TaxID=330153 RepID=A0A7J6M1Q1_PERCH|nr:hypothetical protein FOL47_004532 [Perkinsus chesapeaki]